MNVRRKLKAHTEIHTGPLNDILFILLLFFLIVSTLANPNVVKVGIPKGDKETKQKQTIIVSVDKANQLFVGNKSTTEANLEADLKVALAKDTINPVVVINADTLAFHGTVFKVMRVAKKLGAKVTETVK